MLLQVAVAQKQAKILFFWFVCFFKRITTTNVYVHALV